MKHLLLAAILVSGMQIASPTVSSASTGPAINSNENFSYRSKANTKELTPSVKSKLTPPVTSRLKAVSDEELVNVTISWEYSNDPDWYDHKPNFILEDNNGGYYDLDSDCTSFVDFTTVVMRIPKGTYHGVMIFETDTPECHGHTKLVFMNDTDISEDTALNFDGKSATHRISFKYCLSNGEEARIIDFKNEAPTYRDYDSGNCTGIAYYLLYSLQNPNVGLQKATYLESNIPEMTGSDRIKCNDIFVNTTSEHYALRNQMILQPTDASICYSSQTMPVCVTSHEITFNGDLDKTFQQKISDFKPVAYPSFKKSLYEGDPLNSISATGDLYKHTGEILFRHINSQNIFNYSAGFNLFSPDIMLMADIDPAAPVLMDFITNEADLHDSISFFECTGTQTPKFTINRDGSINYLMTDNVSVRPPYDELAYVRWMPLSHIDGHPFFSYNSTENEPSFGDSAPILSFPVIQVDSSEDNYFSYAGFMSIPTYLGNFGERRAIDKMVMTFKVKAGDEVITEGYEDFPWSLMAHSATAHDAHEITISFDNTNFEVDGLPGRNYAEVKYTETTSGDISAPTLQMMQLRDSDGKITNKFEDASNATINIAYGDFYHDLQTMSYPTNRCEVKIEAAPFGCDNFREINTEEDSDLYKWPLWGYFRSGKLSTLGQSPNGWWDLRVTLTDEAGNSSFQLISPAFYAADTDTSGIKEVSLNSNFFVNGNIISSTEGLNSTFNIFALDGSNIATVNSKSVDLSDLPKNVYIVKAYNATGSQTLKLIVK